MNKNTLNIKSLFIFLTVSLFPVMIAAQDYTPSDERSSFEDRKKSTMDANRLRASYFNTGHAGRRNNTSLDELIFEFPRNTNREYMYFMSVHFGTEVEAQNSSDILQVVDVASFKTNRDGSQNWSLNPIEGYSRDDSKELARSDRGPGSPLGNTWPDSWPDKFKDGGDGWAGSWNGFFGRDQFNADIEFYYKAGDDRYTRYSNSGAFKPDDTDPTRGGLAIVMDTRVLAWSQILINSVHFNIFEITNDGSYDYPRMSFGLWIADFVAGGGPTDQPVFDNLRAIAYLTDTDRSNAPSSFDGLPIGEMGLSFLETPGNAGDGIDNDGDSDTYDVENAQFYDTDNSDLFSLLLESNGGFYSSETLRDTVVREFIATDFDSRTINIGDKIVLIDENGTRVIKEYDGNSFQSQGVTYNLGASFSVQEETLPLSDPNFGVHIDGLDNDFDGLIDENTPNHLEKTTFVNGVSITKPVRFINYLYFNDGDSLQQGLIVSNQEIRDRMSSDQDFEDLVNDTYDGRLQNHFTSAPMIDEGRGDSFDNDNDWNENFDDVGIEGDPDSPSDGQGDGKATSGAGSNFPGEPNIDKTDVSETDLIGVSRAIIFSAGALQVNLDSDIWFNYLIPGEFDVVGDPGTDQDIYVSSGLFPLRVGESQSFAVAVSAAASTSPTGTAAQDRAQLNANLDQARVAYEADYQFAVAPDPPVLTAVPGDGKVTLYWETNSESSFDRYLNNISGDGFDFEGYKVYRSTDPSFEDIFNVTDAFGNATYYSDIAIFDKNNGIQGLHPVDVNGVKFDMGNDTGLQRSYVDTDVVNGKTYYYAVTGFDFGYVPAGISPSESPIQISQGPDGSITFGVNVVQVRPSRSQAGYIAPDKPQATIVQGSPGGTVSVDIIDPFELKADNLYEVTFEDTLIDGGSDPDTLRTENFTLRNVTEGANDTLIARSPNVNGGNNPITEGFSVSMNNVETFGLNRSRSGWVGSEASNPHDFAFSTESISKVSDYIIVVGANVGFGQSTERTIVDGNDSFTTPSIPTNFKVFNTYTGEEIQYAFDDINVENSNVNPNSCDPTLNAPQDPENEPDSIYVTPPSGVLSAVGGLSGLCSDGVYFIENARDFTDTLTYKIELRPTVTGSNILVTNNPKEGDTLKVFTTKPFSRNDRFQFRMDPENLPKVDSDSAKSALDEILVIPNPYKVSSIYEQEAAGGSRQQNREIHFTGLPVPSNLKIFTSSGVLVREIEVTSRNVQGENGGTYIWDLLTKDNLEIAYGIYIYHVEAKGVGNKTGKFAVIK
ncbi:MAG: hypothetical protein JXR11_11300 [Balneola sp.]